MKLDINNYPGSKGGAGVAEWIINKIPKSNDYNELMGGSAIISRKLYENGVRNIYASELYRPVFEQLNFVCLFTVSNLNAFNIMESFLRDDLFQTLFGKFIYLDPPYIKTSRRSGKDIYGIEWTIDDHLKFLRYVNELSQKGAFVMISHYDDIIYNNALKGWYTDTFQTMTRGGKAEEKIWMNYDIQEHELATYNYLGKNFTDRQRVKRRKESYLKKFRKMPFHEKEAILQYVQNRL